MEWSYNQLYFQDKKNHELSKHTPDIPLTPALYERAINRKDQKPQNQVNKTQVQVNPKQLTYKELEQRHISNNWKIIHTIYSCIIILVMLTVVFHFYNDATNKIQKEIRKKKIKFELCKTEYHENDCENPRPALRQFCLEKEHCLLSDPEKEITKLGTILNLVTEIFNSAVEKTTFKAMITIGVIGLGYAVISIVRAFLGA